ncbi:CLUMA_CG014635, isoform A [Clunio marinus]|uniref:CLUMA_CG014635, isoform A n=1 Tax=Clunio marinus TaxID=568069 RepID=A0A1J1ILF7_9DIPT|nr:CLUMA_CG014635, isoform A [Clunio marinus]
MNVKNFDTQQQDEIYLKHNKLCFVLKSKALQFQFDRDFYNPDRSPDTYTDTMSLYSDISLKSFKND